MPSAPRDDVPDRPGRLGPVPRRARWHRRALLQARCSRSRRLHDRVNTELTNQALFALLGAAVIVVLPGTPPRGPLADRGRRPAPTSRAPRASRSARRSRSSTSCPRLPPLPVLPVLGDARAPVPPHRLARRAAVAPAAIWLGGGRQALLDNRPKTAFPDRTSSRCATTGPTGSSTPRCSSACPVRARALSIHGRIAVDLFHDSSAPDVVLGSHGYRYFTPGTRPCGDPPPAHDPADAAQILALTLVAAGKRALVLEPADKLFVHAAGRPGRRRRPGAARVRARAPGAGRAAAAGDEGRGVDRRGAAHAGGRRHADLPEDRHPLERHRPR